MEKCLRCYKVKEQFSLVDAMTHGAVEAYMYLHLKSAEDGGKWSATGP
jgi:hypothetical protein